MAFFRIVDQSNGNTLEVELIFNPNPLGSNTWTTVKDSSNLLGLNQGLWNSDGLQNRVIIRDNSNNEIAYFDRINTAVSLTDPFQNLRPGDSGSGLLRSGGLIEWTFL